MDTEGILGSAASQISSEIKFTHFDVKVIFQQIQIVSFQQIQIVFHLYIKKFLHFCTKE